MLQKLSVPETIVNVSFDKSSKKIDLKQKSSTNNEKVEMCFNIKEFRRRFSFTINDLANVIKTKIEYLKEDIRKHGIYAKKELDRLIKTIDESLGSSFKTVEDSREDFKQMKDLYRIYYSINDKVLIKNLVGTLKFNKKYDIQLKILDAQAIVKLPFYRVAFREGLLVQIIRLRDFKKIASLKCDEGLRDNLTILSNNRIATADAAFIRVWNLYNFNCLVKLNIKPIILDNSPIFMWNLNSAIRLVEVKQNLLAVFTGDLKIRIYDLDQECLVGFFNEDLHILKQEDIFLTVLNEGLISSYSISDTKIKVWDIKDFRCSVMLLSRENCIQSLTVLPGEKIISCSLDLSLKIWDLSTYKCERMIKSQNRSNFSKLLSRNLLATYSDNGIHVDLWNPNDLSFVHTLSEHFYGIKSLTLVSDKLLAVGVISNNVKLWSLEDFTCIKILDKTFGCSAIYCISDHELLTINFLKELKLWDLGNFTFKILSLQDVC